MDYSKNKIKICFVSENPKTIGGMSLFVKNLISYIQQQKEEFEITWIHRSEENKEISREGIKYLGMKLPNMFLMKDLVFNKKIKRFLERNDFDIINSHAIWGHWMKNYKKKKDMKLVHTYHGTTYYFYKDHFKRLGFFKKVLYSPLLMFGYFIERTPTRKADKIICVSEKVKRQVESLYGKQKNISVIRTGVNLKDFRPRNKDKTRTQLNLDKDKIYGLYVGGGGYWTKGLDRTIKLGKEIYSKNKKFRLIIIGPDYKKVKHLLEEKFIIFLQNIPRNKMPLYYSASDLFFCMSRYEGGAPTLVTSESMASGCLLISTESAEQEIIADKHNALIVNNYDKKDAEKILNILKNKAEKERIIKNSIKTIKDLSLEKWAKKYLEVLTK